jgi:hypothetical protein
MNTPGQRSTRVGLALLGVMVALLSIASVAGSGLSPVVALGIVAAYMAVAFVVLTRFDVSRITSLPERMRAGAEANRHLNRQTGAGRRATERARSRADYGLGARETLLDIGLLLNDRRPDGSWARRLSNTPSLEDGFAQPYLKLFVPAEQGERRAQIAFAIYDRAGNVQFEHVMSEYLRTGDNLILCDRQLALRGQSDGMRVGTWDLRVKIDGVPLALHDFSMSSARPERPQREAEASATAARRLSVEDDEEFAAPVSLEDLLREQARRSANARD